MKDAFKDFGCFEGSKKWEQAIKRENPIYSRNDVRSEFERDYTRILHCQAYRRLKHKTQVFLHLTMIMYVLEWNMLCMWLPLQRRLQNIWG